MKKMLPVLLLVSTSCGAPAPRLDVAQDRAVLEAPAAKVVAVANPVAGGRLIEYSLGGENILLKDRGFQLDIGPEMRKIPAHPAIWTGKYTALPFGTSSVRLSSEIDPALGVRVVKEVGIDPANGALEIVGKMRNEAGREVSYCFWDRTLVEGKGWCLLPTNPKSKFPAKWVLGKRTPTTPWEYDGQNPSHPDMKLMDGVLVVKTGGPEQKVGTDTMDGWIAYARGKLLFVKYFPCYPAGKYTDGGLSLAHYYQPAFSELEPISPEVTLRAGQEYVFPQAWALIPLEKEVTSFEEARALVSRLPKSPFK
ncbi:MAG TPA: hypothetical protein VF950_17215 [Planctomycetota bacterium]